jgi:hypothetical protein
MLPVRPAAMLASIKFRVGRQESVFVARLTRLNARWISRSSVHLRDHGNNVSTRARKRREACQIPPR